MSPCYEHRDGLSLSTVQTNDDFHLSDNKSKEIERNSSAAF